jgi:hypothetical protein
MGFYIWNKEEMVDGNHKDKAARLLAAYPDIKEVTREQARFDRTGMTALVCVVQNGKFDTVPVIFSDDEFLDFYQHDGRPKRWLVMPRALALKLCPAVKDSLPRPQKTYQYQETQEKVKVLSNERRGPPACLTL